MLEKIFKLKENKTNIKTEIIAGTATFLSLAYILAVNPLILSEAGMDYGAVFVATCLSAIIGTAIMGFYANLPIAQAPGMGLNAFFTYTVVLTMGYQWQTALAGVLVSGIIFVIISLTSLRETIIKAIPISLKIAVGIGIGFFISFIGFKNAGLVVSNESTLLTLGDLSSPTVLIAIFGILLTLILMVLKIKFSIFIGLIITAIIGVIIGVSELPSTIISMPPSLGPTFGQVFQVNLNEIFSIDFLIIVFSFFFMDFFDTAGTLVAVASQANLLKKDGSIKNGKKALISDAVATCSGAILGTSSVSSYIESLVGIEQGGKTGLTSIIVSILLFLSLFFSPLLSLFSGFVTAPALIIVGILMIQSVKKIDWEDMPTMFSSFFIIIMMIISGSIADGISIGFLLYVILMISTKRTKEIHPIMYPLCILFILNFIT